MYESFTLILMTLSLAANIGLSALDVKTASCVTTVVFLATPDIVSLVSANTQPTETRSNIEIINANII